MIVRITSKFGEVSQLHPTGHKGVDIALNEGTPLRSVYDGIIEKVYDGSTNIGKGVKVQFEDGTHGIYGHMSDTSPVKVGQMVQDGQIIGYSGNTGRSTGEHLHFALQDNGQFIDPTSLVEQTVNSSLLDRFIENGTIGNIDYPSAWGWLGNKLASVFIQDWIANYMIVLPVLFGVSIGVWGLLNMISGRLANLGVGFVLVLGGLLII